MRRVVLIGLDGSGKSANLDLLRQDPAFAGWHFMWARWEPALLKPLYRFIRRREGAPPPDGEAVRAHQAREYDKRTDFKKRLFRSAAVRKLWMFLVVRDYRAQFRRRFRPYRDGDVIFDRYYLDLFVDQGLNLGLPPDRIVEEVARYREKFPGVDRIIYIRVPPQVCFDRKADVPSLGYLQSRYELYELLAARHGWAVVDGQAPLEDVNRAVRRLVLGA